MHSKRNATGDHYTHKGCGPQTDRSSNLAENVGPTKSPVRCSDPSTDMGRSQHYHMPPWGQQGSWGWGASTHWLCTALPSMVT